MTRTSYQLCIPLLDPVSGAMPFSLNEMVELASILRDVCLGLVELAYPDTRPSTSFNFIKTRTSTGNTQEDTRLWMHLFKVSLMIEHMNSNE